MAKKGKSYRVLRTEYALGIGDSKPFDVQAGQILTDWPEDVTDALVASEVAEEMED